jgi:hypothetical protein
VAEAAEPEPEDAANLSTRRRVIVWSLGMLLVYSALVVGFTWNIWSDPTHIFVGQGGDPYLTMSFFALTQRAVSLHQNPFFTTYLNAPHGVNLAWETTSPLAGMLVWPVDAIFGPIAGFNLAFVSALILNAWLASIAIFKVVGGRFAASIGGLLYGFSPFVIAHGRGHLELIVLVTPPLLMLVLNRMLRTHRQRWKLNGALLAAVVVAQFYISSEVLIIEAIATGVLLVVFAALNLRQARRLFADTARTTAVALGLSLLAVAWPLYVNFTYPQRPSGAIQGTDIYVADVLNLVIPNNNMAISPFNAFASHFSGNGTEATAFVGIPLAILLVTVLVWRRRDRFVLAVAGIGVILAIFSFGGYVHVRGHVVHQLPLPWKLVENLPILLDLLPGRFWLVIYLLIAVVVAVGINEAMHRGRRAKILVGGLVVLTAVTFFPALPVDVGNPTVPAFFTGDVSRIPDASTILLAPVPSTIEPQAELWQAYAGVRFKIVGGYIHGPEHDHIPTMPTLGETIEAIQTGRPATPTDTVILEHMRADLARDGIHTVVLGPSPEHDALLTLLTEVCDTPPVSDQGTQVWWTCVG